MKNLVSTPDFMSSLVIYLRFCRESRKLSQNELSSMLNIGVRTYQRIEAGETSPSVDLIHKISKVLKIDFSEIMINQNPKDLIEVFNLNVNENKILFSVDELNLIHELVNSLKDIQKDSSEINFDSITNLDIFVNSKMNVAISDPRWTFLNINARKFFKNEDEKIISCLNQRKQELGKMWANLIQNKIEAFSSSHKTGLKDEENELLFNSRNSFIRLENKFFIITFID